MIFKRNKLAQDQNVNFLPWTNLFMLLGIIVFSISCKMPSPYFQKQVAIPQTLWDYSFQPEFKINITDTQASYRFYFLIRHDDAYPNANIWIRMSVKAPGDSLFNEGIRIDKTLADAEGKWLGKGMGSIWEHKIPLTTKEMPVFKTPGIYEIKMEQIMRTNPLPSVLNTGLMIEKVPH